MSMLTKRFPRLDEDERLAIYHDAWTRVYAKRKQGEEIESLRAYLLATAAGEALHALSRGKPPAPIGPDDPLLTSLADDDLVEEQVVRRDQVRIARDLIESLDRRQRDVLKLRWDLQLSGTEIRAALNLSPRQYQRLVEEGAVAIAKRVRELEDGTWSRRQRSLLTACLVEVGDDGERRVGFASERQRKEAQRLLESDPHFAALYAEARNALKRASVLLPLPVLLGESDASAASRVLELVSDVRSQLSSAIETGKQQATSLYLRVGDPTTFSSPRPGAAMAAVAGCLAVGGGAYGAHEAVSTPPGAAVAQGPIQAVMTPPPVRASHGEGGDHQNRPRRRTRAKKSSTSTPAATPASQPTQVTQPIQHTTAAPIPQPTSPSGTEFGFED